ncbi:lipopolysaccharide kinase InaA family protein [Natronospora cellulosivora (SeqCode)]
MSRKIDDNIYAYFDNNNLEEMTIKIIDFVWKEKYENNKSFKLIQNTKKSRVYKFTYNSIEYYFKYYQPYKIKKIIKNQFRKVEALRHYNTASALLSVDVPTIKPCIAITNRINILYKESIFVMKEVKGVTVEEYLGNKKITYKQRREIIKQMALIYSKLVNNKYLHQDPTLFNFLIKEEGNSLKLTMIDVDNIYKVKYFPKNLIIYTIAKLYARILCDIYEYNLEPLNKKEVYLFLNTFLSNCNKYLNKNQFINLINKKAIKLLLKYNGRDIIDMDIVLRNYQL